MERYAGILLHPSSLPSPFGIGDLGKSAYEFIDFLYESQIGIWQVLPLGPTSFGDSPYQSFSTFAGNPMLISPELLIKDKLLEDNEYVTNFDKNTVEYGKVIAYKNKLLLKAFENFESLDKKEFNKFCEEKKLWLKDYAVFMAIKNHFIEERKLQFESEEYKVFYKENINLLSLGEIKDNFYGASWNSWDLSLKFREKAAMETYENKLEKEIRFHMFVQYIFFKQWNDIKSYCNKKGILIIGDIPIFVAEDSADVWANPSLFYMDKNLVSTKVAGVPPDYFSKTGQLWGNPLYDWNYHKLTNYAWWITRIEETTKMVDILRIDHFRGFDEYWAVERGSKTAEKGNWEKGPGKELFEAAEKKLGKLAILAEDLGIITENVRTLRESLGFPGMRILQFAFDGFDEGNKNLYLPHNIESINTAIYTGTHDNDTTVGWYEDLDEKLKDHVRRYLNVSGENIAWDFIKLAFSSVAKYAIVPLQDTMKLGKTHRMNSPGIPSDNWKFRYRKEMLTKDISEGLRYMVKLYNRENKKIDEDMKIIGEKNIIN